MSRNSELADRICRRFCNGPEAETLGDIVDREVKNELAALREDKERLDWMEDNIHALHYGLECKVCVRGEDGMEFNGENWRAAIDAARTKEGGAK